MDELLEALRHGDEQRINEIASKLLVTHDKHVNKAQANEFERFAPCRVIPLESTIFKSRCYIGIIEYNQKQYSFGG